jgi:hypothetical protein
VLLSFPGCQGAAPSRGLGRRSRPRFPLGNT